MNLEKDLLNSVSEDGKNAVIYLRVSTEEQVDNFSLGTQEKICRNEANKKGYIVTKVFREEGKSAKSISGRPELIRLLEFCRKKKNKVKGLFVYRLDRISRQTSDYLAIRKKLAEYGANIYSATEPTGNSPTEKLIETILAGFAQLDNDIRGERARNGLRARFLSGLVLGKPPLGYILKSGKAVKDPEAWDKMLDSWNLIATGTKSLREMAVIMNKWGLRSIRGNKIFELRAQSAQRIFRSKFYMGILTSQKYPEEVKGQHIPMVSQSLFYKVQAILDGRNVKKLPFIQRSFSNPDFPLRRIVRCSYCGSGLTAGWSKGRSAKYGYYRCGKPCTGKSIKTENLENNLKEILKQISPKPELLDLFIKNITIIFNKRKSILEKRKQEIENQIYSLQQKRKVLVQKNLDGLYSDEIFKEQLAELENEMTKAQIIKQDNSFEKYDIKKLKDFLRTKLINLDKTYEDSNPSQIKVLLGSIFPNGLIWDYEDKTLNRNISPIYQYIQKRDALSVPSSGAYGSRTFISHTLSSLIGVNYTKNGTNGTV